MLYQNYERKVLRVIGFLRAVRRHRVLIISIASAIIALISLFLGTKGMILTESGTDGKIEYGEKIEYSAGALFSDVYCEFKAEGADAWSASHPTEVGKYVMRVVSYGSFGTKRYGGERSLEISPKQISVSVSEDEIRYGDTPSASADLAYEDTLYCVDFIYDNIGSEKTGVSPDKDKVVIKNKDGADVTSQYIIKAEKKELTLTRRELSVTVESVTQEYNGRELSSDVYEVSGGDLLTGDKIVAVFDKSITDVGEISNPPSSLVILNKNAVDVTLHYNITVNEGTLSVTKRPLIVENNGLELVYDGKEHQNTDYTLAEGSLIEGHTLMLDTFPTIKNVGECLNLLLFKVMEGENDVSDNYFITFTGEKYLKITQREINIETRGESFVYDGKEHSNTDYILSEETPLADSHTLIITFFTQVRDVTEGTDNLIEFDISEGETSVKDNYKINLTGGELIVTPRPVTIVSSSGSHIYDGTPFVLPQFEEITDGSLAENHWLDPEFKNSITNVGSIDNEYDLIIRDGGNRDVSKNYALTLKNGTLCVEKRVVSVRALGFEMKYDGKAHSNKEYEVTSPLGFVKGQRVSVESFAEIKNVGRTPNQITLQVYLGNEPVGGNYDIKYDTPEDLVITHREITVRAKDCTTVYDGQSHGCDSYEIGGDGLAENQWEAVVLEGAYITAGTHTGYVKSVEVYDENNTPVTENYICAKIDGTVKIEKRHVVAVSADASKVYDGQILENKSFFFDTEMGYDIVEGQEAICTFNDGITTVIESGEQNNIFVIEEIVIRDTLGNIVEKTTDNYIIEYVYGSLTVKERPITLVSQSESKVYDDTPLTKWEYEILIDETHPYGLVKGQKTDITYTGTVTNATRDEAEYADNTFTVDKIYIEATGEETTSNYKITREFGKLIINPRPIVIISASDSRVYDSTELKRHEYSLDLNRGMEMVSGHCLDIEYLTSITDVNKETVYNDYILKGIFRSTDTEKANDLQTNYDITLERGTLEITKRPVTLLTASEERVYDGAPLFNRGVTDISTGYDTGLINGHTVKITQPVSIINVSRVDNTHKSLSIMYINEDKTENYEITVEYGTLEITERAITITPADAERTYDGTPLVASEYIIGGLKLAVGDYISKITFDGSQTNKGSSQSQITEVEIRNGKNEIVTLNYSIDKSGKGSLRVLPRKISVMANSDSKVYDDTPLVNGGVTVGGEGLAKAQRIEAVVLGSITDVGTTGNILVSFEIYDNSNSPVTENYEVTGTENGTLEITPRIIRIKSKSSVREYNAEVLFNHGYEVFSQYETHFPEGHSPLFDSFASITNVGKIDNTYNVIIVNAQGEDKTSNYQLATEDIYGTLEVTPRIIKIFTQGGTKIYDGTPLQVLDGYTLETDRLILGHSHSVTITGKQILAGSSRNTAKLSVTDENGEDISGNYMLDATEENYGLLTVEKCVVQISTGSASKPYDGAPLTCNIWSSENWEGTQAYKNGHRLIVSVTGKRTTVGKSENYFSVAVLNSNGEVVTSSFDFETSAQIGILEVTPIPLVFTSFDTLKEYDGFPIGSIYVEMIQGCLYEGHYFEVYDSLESLVNVTDGIIENTYKIRIMDSEGNEVEHGTYEIECRFAGLQISKCKLTIEAESAVMPYDGVTTLYAPQSIIEPNSKLDMLNEIANGGYTWQVTVEGSQRDAGTSPARIVSFRLYLDGEAVDMNNFELTFIDGELTVATKYISVILYQIEKYYDGTPLSYEKNDYYFDKKQLPSGYELHLELSGSITNAGSLDKKELLDSLISTGALYITDDAGNNVTEEYYIELVGQPLTVKPIEITITTDSAEKVYDGKPLTCNTYKITGKLIDGHVIKGDFITGKQTGVGTSPNTGRPLRVTIMSGDSDVTNNYEINIVSGTLTVTAD